MDNPDLPRAGLLRRLLALVYDSFLLVAVMMVGTLPWLPFTGGEAIAAGHWLFRLYLVGLIWLFYAWFWTHGGQTLGMRAWRLRLRRANGKSVRWRDAMLRAPAALLSSLAGGLGWLWVLFRGERLTWHDRLSGTEVVVLPKR